MFKLDLGVRGTRDQIANMCWIIEKARESPKTVSYASLTMLKPLTVWIKTNQEILKEMGKPDHLTCLLRSNSFNWTWNNGLLSHCSILGKEYDKVYIPTLLI